MEESIGISFGTGYHGQTGPGGVTKSEIDQNFYNIIEHIE